MLIFDFFTMNTWFLNKMLSDFSVTMNIPNYSEGFLIHKNYQNSMHTDRLFMYAGGRRGGLGVSNVGIHQGVYL